MVTLVTSLLVAFFTCLLTSLLVPVLDLVTSVIVQALTITEDGTSYLSNFFESIDLQFATGTPYQVFVAMAYAITIIILILELLKNFGLGKLTDVESPVVLVFRFILSFLCIYSAKPLFEIALRITAIPYAEMSTTIEESFWENASDLINNILVSFLPENLLLGLVVRFVIIILLSWNFIKLAIGAIERYCVLGILYYTAPLAFSAVASKNSSNVFKSWCRMVVSNCLLIIFSVFFLQVSCNAIVDLLSDPSLFFSDLVFRTLLITSFMRIGCNFERYLSTTGLSTPATGQGIFSDILLAARALSGVTRPVKAAGKTTASNFTTAMGNNAGNFRTGMASFMSMGNPFSAGKVNGVGGSSGYKSQSVTESFANAAGNTSGKKKAMNGVSLSASEMSSVLMQRGSTPVFGQGVDKGLGGYFSSLNGMKISNAQAGFGKATASVITPNGRVANVSLTSAATSARPEGAYKTVSDAFGNQWYMTASGPGASSIYGSESPLFNGNESKKELQNIFGEDTSIAKVSPIEGTVGQYSYVNDDGSTGVLYDTNLYSSDLPNDSLDTVQTTDGNAFFDAPDESFDTNETGFDVSDTANPLDETNFATTDDINDYLDNAIPDSESYGLSYDADADAFNLETGAFTRDYVNTNGEEGQLSLTPVMDGIEQPDGSALVTMSDGNMYYAQYSGEAAEDVKNMVEGQQADAFANASVIPSDIINVGENSDIAAVSYDGNSGSSVDYTENSDGSLHAVANTAEGHNVEMDIIPESTANHDVNGDVVDNVDSFMAENGYSKIDSVENPDGTFTSSYAKDDSIANVTTGNSTANDVNADTPVIQYGNSVDCYNENASNSIAFSGDNAEALSDSFAQKAQSAFDISENYPNTLSNTVYTPIVSSVDGFAFNGNATDNADNFMAENGYEKVSSVNNLDGTVTSTYAKDDSTAKVTTGKSTANDVDADTPVIQYGNSVDYYGNKASSNVAFSGDNAEALSDSFAQKAQSAFDVKDSLDKDKTYGTQEEAKNAVSTAFTNSSDTYAHTANNSSQPNYGENTQPVNGIYNIPEKILDKAMNNVVSPDYNYSHSTVDSNGNISTFVTTNNGHTAAILGVVNNNSGYTPSDIYRNGYSNEVAAVDGFSFKDYNAGKNADRFMQENGYSRDNSVVNEDGSVTTSYIGQDSKTTSITVGSTSLDNNTRVNKDGNTVSYKTDTGAYSVSFNGNNSNQLASQFDSKAQTSYAVKDGIQQSLDKHSVAQSSGYTANTVSDVDRHLENVGYSLDSTAGKNTATYTNAKGQSIEVQYSQNGKDTVAGVKSVDGFNLSADNTDSFMESHGYHKEHSKAHSDGSVSTSYTDSKGNSTTVVSSHSDDSSGRNEVSASANTVSYNYDGQKHSVQFSGNNASSLSTEFSRKAEQSIKTASSISEISNNAVSTANGIRQGSQLTASSYINSPSLQKIEAERASTTTKIGTSIDGYMAKHNFAKVEGSDKINENGVRSAAYTNGKETVTATYGSSTKVVSNSSDLSAHRSDFSHRGNRYAAEFISDKGNSKIGKDYSYSGDRSFTNSAKASSAPHFERVEGTKSMVANKNTVSTFIPSYSAAVVNSGKSIVATDVSNFKNGVFEVRTMDKDSTLSGTKFYSASRYEQPRGEFKIITDSQGGRWYAVEGKISTAKNIVTDKSGKPIVNPDTGEKVKKEVVSAKYPDARRHEGILKKKDSEKGNTSVNNKEKTNNPFDNRYN